MASRVKAISSPIQVPMAAPSFTDHTAPNATIASYPAGSGKVTVTSGEW